MKTEGAWCVACHVWWHYWRKRGLSAWGRYNDRLTLATSRIELRGAMRFAATKRGKRRKAVGVRHRATG